MHKLAITLLILSLTLLISPVPEVSAVSYDLSGAQTLIGPFTGGIGGYRTLAVDVLSNQTVTSVGIYAGFAAPRTLIAEIWQMSGTIPTTQIATASIAVSASGVILHTVPISAQLQAGQRYAIGFIGWDSSTDTMTYVHFDNGTLDPASGYTVGPYLVLDGSESPSIPESTWVNLFMPWVVIDDTVISQLPAPQVGMISISASQAQPVYESAGGGVVRDTDGNELWLPQDYDGNGYDTHLVMSSTEIDGQIWYQLWIGNTSGMVWVPADKVTIVE